MSGRKRITVDSSEYDSLRQQASQLRALRSDLPETIEASLRQIATDMRGSLRPLEQRQAEFQQALGGLNQDLRAMELETARRLAEQDRAWQQSLDALAQSQAADLAELRQETWQLLQAQESRLNAAIQQERQRREQQVQQIKDRLGTLENSQRQREELAQSWLQGAQAQLDFIGGHYRHAQFAPGALAKLEREVQLARQNAAQNSPEAALSMAQQAYLGLSDLRLDLERLEREWQYWRSAALATARELLVEAQRNRLCSGVNLQGEPVDLDVEVDFWTQGKLTRLQQEIQGLLEGVEHPKTAQTTAQLRQVAQEQAPAYLKQLGDLVAEARLAVISSQMRFSIADLVVQALEAQGFAVQEGVYEGEDMRAGYVAKVAHYDGAEVVVSVTPDPARPGENEVNIHSFDVEQVSEVELRRRSQEVARTLQAQGLTASAPQPTGLVPNPAIKDIEAVKRKKTIPAQR